MYSHAVRHVREMPEGPHIGALFACDGTLIDGISSLYMVRELLGRAPRQPANLARFAGTAISQLPGGSNLFEWSRNEKPGRGISESLYIEAGRAVYENHLSNIVFPEARALIAAHREKGHTIAILSAGSCYPIRPLADELGVEHLYCCRYEVENGDFSGRIVQATYSDEGKLQVLDDIEAQLDLDLSNSCFYTGRDADLTGLDRVGLPRVVNPSEQLDSIASARGWPVQIFARTGKPSLTENIRSVGVYGALLGSYFAGLSVRKLSGSSDEGRRFMLSNFTDIAFALTGVRINVINRGNLWSHQPAVILFNHQSQADGIVMMHLFQDNFAAVGKKEIGKVKLLADAYDFAGVVRIDRENAASAIEAMQPLVDTLKVQRRNVVIAPEGTRSESKKPGPFKKGAFHVAMQAGVPVLPVVIHNAIDIQPKGQFAYRPGVIEVEVLPPVDTSGWTTESLDENVNEIRNMFLVALGFEPEYSPRAKVKRDS